MGLEIVTVTLESVVKDVGGVAALVSTLSEASDFRPATAGEAPL